jgi:hypothetical protein
MRGARNHDETAESNDETRSRRSRLGVIAITGSGNPLENPLEGGIRGSQTDTVASRGGCCVSRLKGAALCGGRA